MAANFTNDEPVSVSLNDDNSRQNSQLYTHRNLRSKNFNNKNEFNVNENRLTQHVEDDDIIFLDDTKENRPTVKVRDQFIRSILIDEDDDKDEDNDSEKKNDLKNDEMLARQLQEEFDKELAISLEHDFIRDENAQRNGSDRANEQPTGQDFFYNLRRLRGSRRETAELGTAAAAAAATGEPASDQQTGPDFFLRQANRSTSSSDEGTTNNQTDSARSAASLLPPSFETDILYSLARNSARNNQHNNNVNNNHRHGIPPFSLPRNNNNNNQRNTRQTNNRNQNTPNDNLFSFTDGNNDSLRNLEQAFSILAQPERASQSAREERPANSNNYNRNHFTRNGNMRMGQLMFGQNRDHNQQPANIINHHTVNSQSRPPQQRTRIRNNIPFFNFQLLGNRDFSSNDYENLLRLDEINGVKKSLNKNEIDSLVIFEYKASGDKSNDSNAETCSICYDEFAAKDLLMALSCMHKFHKKCIVQWFQESRRCPLCQKDAVTGE